jgi:hypothetical protein
MPDYAARRQYNLAARAAVPRLHSTPGFVPSPAAHLATVCAVHGAGFASVKYVTDGVDHASATDWQENVHKAADDFLRLFRTLMPSR